MREFIAKLRVFFREHILLLILVLLQVIVFHRWIFQDALFTFGDLGVYLPETQRELLSNSFSFYSSNMSFGDINIASSSNPFILLFGLLATFGVSYVWSMKWLIFYPTVFGVVISSYFLILQLTNSKKGAFFGSLAYAYNTYFLITLTGALYISLAYALSPLILLLFIQILKKPTLKKQLEFAFLLAAIGYIEFRLLYINFFIIAIYFIFYLYCEKKSFHEVWKQTRYFFLPILIFILLNVFWIIPFLISGELSQNDLFSRGLFGDGYFDMVNALAIFHPWWTGSVPSIFIKQIAGAHFFIVPFIVFCTILLPFRKRLIPFLVLFVIGVLLTKQSSEPFKSLYLWFYQHMPGFNAFRESSKFYLISSLSSAALIGFSISSISRFFKNEKLFRFILFILFLFFIIQAKPILTSSMGTVFIPRSYPVEYQYLNNFINNDRNFSRILWFPHTNRFGTYTNLHPGITSLVDLNKTFKKFVDPSEKDFSDSLYSIFEDDHFSTFLNNTSIRYIIIPSNLKWDDVKSPWRNPTLYTDRMDKLNYLSPVQDDYLLKHDIHVYENRDYRPHISLSDDMPRYQNTTSIEPVEYQAISSTEYRISVRHLREPLYLNFSENYHPDWRLRIGKFKWFGQFLENNYFLPDIFSVKNDFELSSFRLDPEAIKQNTPNERYRKNEDGSIDFELTLYFSSQSFYTAGLYLGATTLSICLLAYIYAIVTKKIPQTKQKYE